MNGIDTFESSSRWLRPKNKLTFEMQSARYPEFMFILIVLHKLGGSVKMSICSFHSQS